MSLERDSLKTVIDSVKVSLNDISGEMINLDKATRVRTDGKQELLSLSDSKRVKIDVKIEEVTKQAQQINDDARSYAK